MSAVAVIAALEDRDVTGRGLRVEFFRLRDRYAHRILAVGCEELPVILLESVEGTAEDIWPPSPAFQALNLEGLQDGSESSESSSIAMLVGMSGTTHWSMSVNSLFDTGAYGDIRGQPGFYFDAAGRLKSVPKVLSTQYFVGKRLHVQPSDRGILLHFGSGRCAFEPSTTGDAPTSSSLRHDARKQELQLLIAPLDASCALPATLRWSYSLSLFAD